MRWKHFAFLGAVGFAIAALQISVPVAAEGVSANERAMYEVCAVLEPDKSRPACLKWLRRMSRVARWNELLPAARAADAALRACGVQSRGPVERGVQDVVDGGIGRCEKKSGPARAEAYQRTLLSYYRCLSARSCAELRNQRKKGARPCSTLRAEVQWRCRGASGPTKGGRGGSPCPEVFSDAFFRGDHAEIVARLMLPNGVLERTKVQERSGTVVLRGAGLFARVRQKFTSDFGRGHFSGGGANVEWRFLGCRVRIAPILQGSGVAVQVEPL